MEEQEKYYHCKLQNILAINVLESIFYSVDELQRTKLSRISRGLDNVFTPAVFCSINNLYCQKPVLMGQLYFTEIKSYNGRIQIFL